MIKGYSGVAQELQHLRASQGFRYTDHSGAEGNGPALLPCHTPQREAAYEDSTGSFTLKKAYKKSFQQVRLTQLLITTTLLRINFKTLRRSSPCREKLVKRANVAIS